MKTIIEKNNGYAVTEWIPEVKPHDYRDTSMNAYEHAKDRRIQQLASQPSVQVHPDYVDQLVGKNKENLYQPIEDDRIEVQLIYRWNEGNYHNTCSVCKSLITGCAKLQFVCKSCCETYGYYVPKQPVEVKRKTAAEVLAEQKREEEDMVSKLSSTLPVEKEGEDEIDKIIDSLCLPEKLHNKPYRGYAVNILMRVAMRKLADRLTTAPPAEDWVSVEREIGEAAEGLLETAHGKDWDRENAYLISDFYTACLNYLKSNFTLHRKKKD